jgi:hypothetical protein
MLHQRDEDALGRACLTGVAQHRGHLRREVQCDPDVAGVVAGRAVEAVDGDGERQAALLEVVHRGKAVGQAPDVSEYHGTERPIRKLVSHEPETFLARRPEQVEHHPAADGDPPVVEGDRRGGLAAHRRRTHQR